MELTSKDVVINDADFFIRFKRPNGIASSISMYTHETAIMMAIDLHANAWCVVHVTHRTDTSYSFYIDEDGNIMNMDD